MSFPNNPSKQTPTLQQKPKIDIPTPTILSVKDYDRDVPATYRVPRSYIRYKRKDYDEEIEFVIDREDEEWYQKTRFGPLAKDETESRSVLPLGMLERMLDLLEKLTGFDTIVTRDQAEKEILRQLPVLDRMFPRKDGGVTAKQVIMDVYGYWVQKRSKLKRPLLRRFWPVTASDDTNPHLVFRPREKEKYKLRKKRQNDMALVIHLQASQLSIRNLDL